MLKRFFIVAAMLLASCALHASVLAEEIALTTRTTHTFQSVHHGFESLTFDLAISASEPRNAFQYVVSGAFVPSDQAFEVRVSDNVVSFAVTGTAHFREGSCKSATVRGESGVVCDLAHEDFISGARTTFSLKKKDENVFGLHVEVAGETSRLVGELQLPHVTGIDASVEQSVMGLRDCNEDAWTKCVWGDIFATSEGVQFQPESIDSVVEDELCERTCRITESEEGQLHECGVERPVEAKTARQCAFHTVQVAPSGALRFEPAALNIRACDTVFFNASGSTGSHSIIFTNQRQGNAARCGGTPISGISIPITRVPFSRSITFPTTGFFTYYCMVANHCNMGMRGSITVAAGTTVATTRASTSTTSSTTSSTRAASSTTRATSTTSSTRAVTSSTTRAASSTSTTTRAASSTTRASSTLSTSARAVSSTTRAVSTTATTGHTCRNYTVNVVGLAFVPPSLAISPCDTVTWNVTTGTHSITFTTAIANDSAVCGGVSIEGMTRPVGPAPFVYPLLFPQSGIFYYYCNASTHCASGMKGRIIVSGTPTTSIAAASTGTTGRASVTRTLTGITTGNFAIVETAATSTGSTTSPLSSTLWIYQHPCDPYEPIFAKFAEYLGIGTDRITMKMHKCPYTALSISGDDGSSLANSLRLFINTGAYVVDGVHSAAFEQPPGKPKKRLSSMQKAMIALIVIACVAIIIAVILVIVALKARRDVKKWDS